MLKQSSRFWFSFVVVVVVVDHLAVGHCCVNTVYCMFSRGVEPYDSPTTVLVQRHEPQGVSSILSSTDFFQSEENRRIILERVDSFQLRDKYMFATTTRVRSAWGKHGSSLWCDGRNVQYRKLTLLTKRCTTDGATLGLHEWQCVYQKSLV